MEKRLPHCRLSLVKAKVQAGKVRMTVSALAGGAAMGLDAGAIIEVIMALTPGNFYKSMSTHKDHRQWQDVYRPVTPAGAVYLKLTVVDEVIVISFKEL